MAIGRTVLWTALGLVVVGAAGFAFLAYEREIAPIARPDPASFDKALVERGRVLANYGDCTACHTRPDGPPFAGNFALKTPFGTIYTSNITPDPETGRGSHACGILKHRRKVAKSARCEFDNAIFVGTLRGFIHSQSSAHKRMAAWVNFILVCGPKDITSPNLNVRY